MRRISSYLSITLAIIFLSGCDDTLNDIKNAASGINSAATNAATAISQDVHTLRATDIHYKDEHFTINDLFKSILRDVQWHYEQSDATDILKVTGTWKEPLFAHYDFEEAFKKELVESSKVTVVLTFKNGNIQSEETSLKMELNGEIVVEEHGEIALTQFYDIYVK
ncbi:23S rRNA methyltransferase [Solibacillus sp. CAU 1738]|uniref:23S rRNA methyltransferase n=1 Tax=Solibacillus sp. CAU 1738 TaxID=3140363 RepID=UPI0032601CCC